MIWLSFENLCVIGSIWIKFLVVAQIENWRVALKQHTWSHFTSGSFKIGKKQKKTDKWDLIGWPGTWSKMDCKKAQIRNGSKKAEGLENKKAAMLGLAHEADQKLIEKYSKKVEVLG